MYQINRRQFLKSFALGTASIAMTGCTETLQTSTAKNTDKPNYIIIFADDLGYGDLSCFGSKTINTPNLDKMAAEGMKFTSFYVSASVCTPSRASLMTGRYAQRVGLPKVLFPGSFENAEQSGPQKGLWQNEITIAQVLKPVGYSTCCIGKWHLGDKKEFLPTSHGFDEFFGTPYSNDMIPPTYPDLPLMQNENVIEKNPNQDFLTQRYTKAAIDFINKNRNQPFFLYLAHSMPHRPVHVSPPFTKRFSKEQLDKINGEDRFSRDFLYPAAVEEIDWSVGKILAELKKLRLDEKTLIIFTSDNGPMIGSAGPLRDGKGSYYEGGFRVPCVMRWMNKIPAGKICNDIATTMDFLPTFAELSAAKTPTDHVIDGKNIQPLMFNKTDAKTPYEVFYYIKHENDPKILAVRSGKWKLVAGKKKQDKFVGQELYDLSSDISETNNLLSTQPQIVEKLTKMADKFYEELKSQQKQAPNEMNEFYTEFRFSPAEGLGSEPNCDRQDNSDIIKVGDTYYIWYTKTDKPGRGYDATVWYATSKDGKKWIEKGEVIARGPQGSWDAQSAFTPNILIAKGKYYLFYTGISEPKTERFRTSIGVAISDSPDGPWEKFSGNPILLPGEGKWLTGSVAEAEKGAQWDSQVVDDACMIVRDGKYWLYYKGRQMGLPTEQTKMGVAIAQEPTGPYVKSELNPLIKSGHEVLVWPYKKGVAALVAPVGPEKNTIQYAEDGLHFKIKAHVKDVPRAPGVYRQDNFSDTSDGEGISWGISVIPGKWPYLVRFDCK